MKFNMQTPRDEDYASAFLMKCHNICAGGVHKQKNTLNNPRRNLRICQRYLRAHRAVGDMFHIFVAIEHTLDKVGRT